MAKRKEIPRADILDEAKRLMETVGFHGFSMRDLGGEVGLSSASLHHHFTTKDDLGMAVLQRERESLNEQFAVMAAEQEEWARRRVESVETLAQSRLTAVLLAELKGLPPKSQEELRLLHSNVTGWLTRFTTEALRRHELLHHTQPEQLAVVLLALALGAALHSDLAPVDLAAFVAD